MQRPGPPLLLYGIVLLFVALAVEHGVGGADHLLAHVLFLALAIEGVGDKREIEGALANAETVGEKAKTVALDRKRLEAPRLLFGRQKIPQDHV